jgi:predicted Rossmann fold flavoprotein
LKRTGTALPVILTLLTGTGKRLHRAKGRLLLTHVGVSGPVVLDMSRHYLAACKKDPGVRLEVQWIPDLTENEVEVALQDMPSRSICKELARDLPRRLAETLLDLAGLPTPGPEVLGRGARRRLIETLFHLPLPITGPVGWQAAEVTAGGIPLDQVNLKTMESRRQPGLFLAGEVLDVDGRIGGFNFQWAWASGHVAGLGVVAGL